MRYVIRICWDSESDYEEYIVCLYDRENGGGTPIEDHYGITDISYPALGDLFFEICEDLGITLDDIEVINEDI